MDRAPPLMLLFAAHAILRSATAFAAPAAPVDIKAAEVRRAFALVGARASDEPALRQERQDHEPSPSFALGAALSAWINAAASLDYDLRTPTGDGGDDEAIGVDCYDERTAFTHLEARRKDLGLTREQATSAAGVADPAIVRAWTAREHLGPNARCR